MKLKLLKSLAIFAALFVFLPFASFAQDARAGKLNLEPYIYKTSDGREFPAELGKLWVRENRDGKSHRLIQIAFVRLKSRAVQPGAPIVWLAGGPGIPGIVMARVPVYFSLFDKLREVSDVILLDQRGTGMSAPNLECPAAANAPPDAFETETKWLRSYVEMSDNCAEHWRNQGVDLAAYNTDAGADDIDDLRQAIGAEKISLIGHSYGTVLAQAVVRRHDKNLRRVVFANTDAPDNLVALPGIWDMLIKKLSYFAGQDVAINKEVLDMETLYRRVLEKFERNPVNLTVTNRKAKQPVKIRVGKIGLQWIVRFAMNDARTYAGLPALFYTIEQGDYSIFTVRMESLYNEFGGRSPMANAADCALGWSAERLAKAQKEKPQSLSGIVNLQWTPHICKAVGTKNGAGLQPRVSSTIPALFISGTLDTNTPPFQAEEVRWGFPDSVHLIVENAGHETLPSKEVQAVVVDFFKGQDIRGRTVSFDKPKFMSIEEAKKPPQNFR